MVWRQSVLLVLLLVVTRTTRSFEIHRHVPVATSVTPRTLDVMGRMRGGSSSDNNVHEEEDGDDEQVEPAAADSKKKLKPEQVEDDEHEDEGEEATMPEDEETQVEEGATEVEEGYEHMEPDDTFHGDEEEEDEEEDMHVEDAFVVEETVLEGETAAIEDQEGEDEVALAQVAEDENEAAVPFTTTQEVLERATAGTTTDDENSSAFVDRMELADAYDIEDSEGAVVEDAEAMAAVSAIAGGSESEEVATIAANDTTITDGMKEILVKELHFTPQDVQVLRPDIAAMLVANKLQKPLEGMLPNWYLPTAVTKKNGNLRQVMLKASVTVIAIGAAALLVVKGQESIDFKQVHDSLSKIPALFVGLLGKGKQSAPSQALIETQSAPEVEEVEEEEHPHSIKPGATEAPAYEQDLDKTPLDKFITKIENIIKAFFRITI